MKRILFALLFTLAVAAPAHAGRWVYTLWTGATTDTTAVGMADSSGVLSTLGATDMVLRLKPNYPCTIAVLIKTWGDSTTVSGAYAASPAAFDTTKCSVWPWHGPILYTASVGWGSAQVDSATYVQRGRAPTSVVAGSEEASFTFPVAAAGKWGYTRQIAIPLNDIWSGRPLRCGFVQVRYRVLTSIAGSMTPTATVTMTGSLECSF